MKWGHLRFICTRASSNSKAPFTNVQMSGVLILFLLRKQKQAAKQMKLGQKQTNKMQTIKLENLHIK